MQINRREAPLELEIQSLLILHGSAPNAGAALLKKYETQKLPLGHLELISTFCLHAGLPASLLVFLGKQVELGSEIPWGYFAEALALGSEEMSETVARAILEGAREQRLTWHLSRSHAFDTFEPGIIKEREMRRRAQSEKILVVKRDLMIQADMFRSQELETEEGRILEKLLGMFPRDIQIQELYAEHRARKALRLLEAKINRPKEKEWDEVEPGLDKEAAEQLRNIAASMQAVWDENGQDSQMGVDFAVAHWMWENPEASLLFLPPDPALPSAIWLRAEVLLRTRRFIELLSELAEIEKRLSYEPEATFAVSYLRAQALWGAGRRFDAIEILEGMLTVKPNYRSASALLAVWKRRMP